LSPAVELMPCSRIITGTLYNHPDF